MWSWWFLPNVAGCRRRSGERQPERGQQALICSAAGCREKASGGEGETPGEAWVVFCIPLIILQLNQTKGHIETELRLFQAEGYQLKERLSEQEKKLRSAEEAGDQKDLRIEELQRLLGGMEQESATLREEFQRRENELKELRRIREDGHKGEQRLASNITLKTVRLSLELF